MLDEYSNDESSMMMAINHSKLGIEIAIGSSIRICSNMTIMGHGQRASNFGSDKITFEQMMELVGLWIKTMKERREKDIQIMDRMKNINISNFYQETREMIGYFNEKLILEPISAPLRQGRITEAHRMLLDDYQGRDGTYTLWEMFNVLTNVSSHQDVIENRISNSAAIGDYFIAKYGLDGRGNIHNIPAEVLEQPMTIAEAQAEVLAEHTKEIIDVVVGEKESAAERIHEKARREEFKTEMEHHERNLMRSDLSEKQKKESREFIEKFKPETSQATSEEKGAKSPEDDKDVVRLF
jgi:hypothetical protein